MAQCTFAKGQCSYAFRGSKSFNPFSKEKISFFFLLLSTGHIHDKRTFCLLAEKFPLILLANLPAAEAI